MAVSRVVFERDARGQILNQIAYNRAARRIYTLHYVHPNTAEYKHEGITDVTRESGLALLRFVRPEHGPEAGLAQEVRYFDSAGTPQPDRDGSYGSRYLFDARGLPIKRSPGSRWAACGDEGWHRDKHHHLRRAGEYDADHLFRT